MSQLNNISIFSHRTEVAGPDHSPWFLFTETQHFSNEQVLGDSGTVAGLVLVWSWSTSKVPLIMLAYQHSRAGEVADEAGHQHTRTSWTPTSNKQHAGQGTPVPESCSVKILICHTCQVDDLSYWILTNVCSTSERSNYFVYIQNKNVWEKWDQQTKCCIYIFSYLVQYLQFVSGALKWPPKSCRFEARVQLTWCTVTTWLTLRPVLGFHSQLHSSSYSAIWNKLLTHAMLVTSIPAPTHQNQHPTLVTVSITYFILQKWGRVKLAVKAQYWTQPCRKNQHRPAYVVLLEAQLYQLVFIWLSCLASLLAATSK